MIRNQLTKAGTSIGANYREANRARSKADFRNKISICEGEASETKYWLEIMEHSGCFFRHARESGHPGQPEITLLDSCFRRNDGPF